MKNVFQTIIRYLREILISQGIVDKEHANACVLKILQHILFWGEKTKEQREKDERKLRKWISRGSVPDIDWKASVLERKKLLTNRKSSNEKFFAIVRECTMSKPDSCVVGKKKGNGELYVEPHNDNSRYYYFLSREDAITEEVKNKIVKDIGYNVFCPWASIISQIYIYIIHGLYGKVVDKIPCGINTPYYLERKVDFEIEENWNFVWVSGTAYSGKTRLLINYAKSRNKTVVYCKNPKSYRDVIERIVIEEDDVLDKETRKILGYRFQNSTDGKVERIRHLVKELVLIIDGYGLKESDIDRFVELSKSDNIQVFVETRLDKHPSADEVHFIYVPPFTEDEAIDLFYLVGEKYKRKRISGKNDELNDILPDVCRVVFNNPGLVILLAENYWWGLERYDPNSGENDPIVFLKSVVDFQPIGELNTNIVGKKYSSSLHYINGKQEQLNFLGHIRHLFDESVPEIEKSAFYVLALLDGIVLKIDYLKNWFGVGDTILRDLKEKGWCCIDQEKSVIVIPQLIVHAMKSDVYEKVGELVVFKEYIENLSRTLNGMEIKQTDVGVMQQVILRLHNVFFVQLRKKISMIDKSIYEFHFSCIRYFLYYGNVVQADLLGNIVNFDKIEGSIIYQDILKKIKNYIGKNDVKNIPEDIIELIKNGNAFRSELGIRAFVDLAYLLSENLFLWGVRALMPLDIRIEEYEKAKNALSALLPVYCIIRELTGQEDIFLLSGMLSYSFDRNINYQQMFDIVYDKEKSWDIIRGKYDDLENLVCNVEKKIYVKSVVLVMYDLLYTYMQIIYNQNDETGKENDDKDIWWEKMPETLSCIKVRIKEIAEQLVVLKSRIHELPCNCAGICLLACGIAGCILQDKSLMQVNDYDFKHMDLYDQQEQEKLKQIISEYRRWGGKEEE